MTRSHLRKALRLLEHALAAIGIAWICQTYVVVVPAGHVYVLGDDTGDAQDSQFIGAVPVERIRGHVLVAFRLWDRWETL